MVPLLERDKPMCKLKPRGDIRTMKTKRLAVVRPCHLRCDNRLFARFVPRIYPHTPASIDIFQDVPNKAFLAQAYMNASSSQTSQLQGGMSTIKLTTPQHAPQMKASHALDMNKFATAKIPFAENSGNTNNGFSNATIAAATATATSAVASASAASAAALGKTPAGGTTRQNQAARSSPQYREGDAISLPEIPTDSEDDEDDDDGDGVGKDFNVPDWAQSPALRQLLEAQQLIDPEQVFGPIAPLHMEEIFKNKDRHHRFRNRTSSANWSGQDRLTQEEIQRDLEARRRLIANGEWSYGMGMS